MLDFINHQQEQHSIPAVSQEEQRCLAQVDSFSVHVLHVTALKAVAFVIEGSC